MRPETLFAYFMTVFYEFHIWRSKHPFIAPWAGHFDFFETARAPNSTSWARSGASLAARIEPKSASTATIVFGRPRERRARHFRHFSTAPHGPRPNLDQFLLGASRRSRFWSARPIFSTQAWTA